MSHASGTFLLPCIWLFVVFGCWLICQDTPKGLYLQYHITFHITFIAVSYQLSTFISLFHCKFTNLQLHSFKCTLLCVWLLLWFLRNLFMLSYETSFLCSLPFIFSSYSCCMNRLLPDDALCSFFNVSTFTNGIKLLFLLTSISNWLPSVTHTSTVLNHNCPQLMSIAIVSGCISRSKCYDHLICFYVRP